MKESYNSQNPFQDLNKITNKKKALYGIFLKRRTPNQFSGQDKYCPFKIF